MTCKHLMRDTTDCVFCERDRLRGELSLAEEGLANAMQELENAKHDIQRLTTIASSEANEVERLRRRVWALATLLYPYHPPREAVAGDIGWTE